MLMLSSNRLLWVAAVSSVLLAGGCASQKKQAAKAGQCTMCAVEVKCGCPTCGSGKPEGCCCRDKEGQAKTVAASVVPADAKKAAPATQPTAEWQNLFDGKTLGKWKITNFGGEGEVQVKDGNLLLPMGATLTGVTWGGEALPTSNYEVALEAQRVSGSDFFVGWTFPVSQSHCSLILGGWGGSLCGISSLNNFDASENETSSAREFKNGKWYEVRVRVTDKKIQAWVDDERIVNVKTEGKKIDTRIEVEDCKPFGLASWQTTAAIREIKLRRLTPLEISQEAASVEKEEEL